MVKAILNGKVLAESNETIIVEGNHYFPPSTVNDKFLTPSDTHTTCPWKGVASYYNASVPGERSVKDAVWYYPTTITDKAKPIEGYVAFYQNKVTISDA